MNQMQSAATTNPDHWHQGNANDPVFSSFRERMQARFAERVPLFTTDAGDLWTTYLAAFPSSTRQSHNCNACHHFIRRYGGLVTIDASGRTQPAFWEVEDAPEEYRAAISQLFLRVKRAKVTGVFLSSAAVFGADIANETWIHYFLGRRDTDIFRSKTQSPYQAMAEKREDYKNVQLALSEHPADDLRTAVQILKSDALYRSEKVLGAAEWLLRLAEVRRDTRHAFANALWLAIATAPAGFCHPRSSMIGTLLEDIEAGLSFDLVAKRFKAKMNPLVYQRPQAPPKAGNIAQAEKLVEQLGIAPSLERRFARLDEIQTLWLPEPPRAPAGGVFGHLQPKEAPSHLLVPSGAITWEKFARVVLPTAKQIEVYTPGQGNFAAFVTAANADAPPILQWDSPEQRNPVSWYLYSGGSFASRWGLRANHWTKVSAVSLQPSMWFGDRFPHQGKGVMFVLDGAKAAAVGPGLMLFPEILKSELHEIRSTIEAHSRSRSLTGAADASACGLMLQGSKAESIAVRVTLESGTAVEYKIDRWD